MHDFIRVCEQAVRAGGEVLCQWSKPIRAREKGPADLVTEVDLASQRAICAVLDDAFPEHDFLGEEGVVDWRAAADAPDGQREAPLRWIADPLDGTTNYVHRLPCYCVSLGLERGGDLLVGAILDPCRDELFQAAKALGASCNQLPMRVSTVARLDQALVAASFPPGMTRDAPELAYFNQVVHRCQAIRRMGSAALTLAYLAAGRIDAYWATSIKPWDVAAGALMVREAGGVISAFDGSPLDIRRPQFLAAATAELHAELLDVLAATPLEPE